MDKKLKRIYLPMSETAFYILFSLQDQHHGYAIGQAVEDLTSGEVRISPGTMYGTLTKMEKDGLIKSVKVIERRKLYQITKLGEEILHTELRRINRLYKNSKGEKYDG